MLLLILKQMRSKKKKIHSISNLATTATLTVIENKKPNASNLVKKNYDVETKVLKLNISPHLIIIANIILNAMITAKMLINESGMNEKIETLALKEEIKKLAAKAELKAQEDKILKLQTYYLSICIGQNYFVNDGAQLYLILQPLYYTLKKTW